MPTTTDSAPTVEVLRGEQILPWLQALAELRLRVFAEWPYLYQGDAAYEAEYLSVYARSAGSVIVLARDQAGWWAAPRPFRWSMNSQPSVDRWNRPDTRRRRSATSANRCCCPAIVVAVWVIASSTPARPPHAVIPP